MKPQALALVQHLNSGGSVTRESAWQQFRIQNITARLSELAAIGFDIIKTPCKALVDGKKITLSAWKMRHTFDKGAQVEVVTDIGTYVSLKGRKGTVQNIDLHKALATVFFGDGVGYRSLRFNCLKRLSYMAPGTPVTIKAVPLVVLDYHPQVDSYALQSPHPTDTIIVSAALVEAVAHATVQ